MTSWIVKIGKEFPEHWEVALADGFWDVPESATALGTLEPGDDVFFWQTGQSELSGFKGWTRATTGVEKITSGSKRARWTDVDGGRYTRRFHFEAVSTALRSNPRWADWNKETYAKMGTRFAAQASVNPVVNGEVQEFLRGLFAPADVGFPGRGVEPMITAHGEDDAATTASPFKADPDEDSREFEGRVIATRRGQPRFRKALLDAYGGACAVTGCTARPALEAAHILPYRGDHTNDVRNGLLLRADVHTLFDLFLITVAEDLTMCVAPRLAGAGYEKYDGQPLLLPAEETHRPSADALAHHRSQCGWLASDDGPM
ncbi:HNH endonuclease [Tomitella fengzijianii]|uniref:HNH endonuclease n=1 Tax=Tomitella fengzijianii TaxID=2597660 RepID=UPI0018EEEA30|nr:HNH endonuclease [Tomitella fengzijianii]